METTEILQALVQVALLALIIERALYQIFDSKLWDQVEALLDRRGDYFDLKPWIAAGLSILIAFTLQFDMLVALGLGEAPDPLTLIVTGLFISGGSKGIYKFLKRARKLKDAAATNNLPMTEGIARPVAESQVVLQPATS